MGHSVGGLIVRAALRQPELAPYRHLLWAFLSIAVPHVGFLFGTNTLINGAVRCLALFKSCACIKQLTFSDASKLEDCFLYQLATSAGPGLEAFRHVILVTCRADQYVPYHSANLAMCRAAESGSGKAAAAYGAMLGALQSRVEASENGTQLARVEVDFGSDMRDWGLGRVIGHTAHVAFLETERYAATLVWGVLHRHGILGAHPGAYL